MSLQLFLRYGVMTALWGHILRYGVTHLALWGHILTIDGGRARLPKSTGTSLQKWNIMGGVEVLLGDIQPQLCETLHEGKVFIERE